MSVTLGLSVFPSNMEDVPKVTQLATNQSQVELDDTHINPRYPNGIMVAILMVVGFVGNSLVLYVYHFKLERTVFTTFVTFLAALDLTTTLTSMPLDMVIKTMMVDKTDKMEAVCKVAHFEAYTSSLASGSILLLIAATRYSKVCRPMHTGWTVRQARVWCLLIVLVAMVLCTVTLVINGMEKVKISLGETHLHHGNQLQNSTQYTNRSTIKENNMLSMKDTAAFEELGDKSTQRSDFQDSALQQTTEPKIVEVYICRASEHQKGTALYYALYALLMTAYVTICLSLLILHCRISTTVVQFKRRRSRQGSVLSDQDQQNLNHITSSMFRIFFTITVIFLLSYLPHLICIIVQSFLFKPGEAMPRVSRVLLDLAYNCPYFNVVSNPFIYGYMSKKFRSHCVHLLCRCCEDDE